MTEKKCYRPEIDRSLQKPLRLTAMKLEKPIKTIVSEAVRRYLIVVLESNIEVERHEPSHTTAGKEQ